MRTGRSVVFRLWLRTHLLFAKKAKSPRKAKTKNAIGKGIKASDAGDGTTPATAAVAPAAPKITVMIMIARARAGHVHAHHGRNEIDIA